MSMRLRFWPAGMALLVGGVIAGTCHLFSLNNGTDVSQLAQYAPLRAPVYLALFAGGMLVLLGWFGYYSLENLNSGAIGLIAFVSVFLGVMWADLLHCILEFSIFPVLDAVAPYALPRLADATYRSVPMAFLQGAGDCLLFAGVPCAAWAIYRSRVLPAWPAVPFAVTAALQAGALMLRRTEMLHVWSFIALYLSLATLGSAVLGHARRRAGSPLRAAPDQSPIVCEDSQPVGR